MVKAAEVFTKINSTQKPVNPSIAFQLFGYSKHRSPQRTAHEIAQTLHVTPGSPFHEQLRMLGTTDGYREGTTSEAKAALEWLKARVMNGGGIGADAMICHKDVCKRIRDGGGHNFVVVKDNQPQLKRDITSAFATAEGFSPLRSAGV